MELLKTNEKTRCFRRRAISHIFTFVNYKSKNQDSNCEIPKSTPVKNRPITTTVVITTIVYFVNSLPFGQLVFLISAPTSRRKFVILLILAIPPNKSYNLSISLLITFAYAMYARCNANKTFLTQGVMYSQFSLVKYSS